MGRSKVKSGGGGGKNGKKNKGYRAPGGGARRKERERGGGSGSTGGRGGHQGQGHGHGDSSGGGFGIGHKNPFEVHINKRKHETLGRGRLGKHETGLPGVSRSRAIKKRKETLLNEYKHRDKTTMFVDKRIGEKNKAMPEEDKLIKRSALEKARQYKKKSIFNLNEDDDLLTHKGQTLMHIDRYDDPRDHSDSEEERLNDEFVSEAHFGGFMKFKRNEDDEGTAEGFEPEKTRDQIIGELILASKKRKFEKAKEMDETYEKVSELDEEFKNPEFRSILQGLKVPSRKEKEASELEDIASRLGLKSQEASASTPVPQPQVPKQVKPEQDEYDRLVRELGFETKSGSASERLKTQEEIAEEDRLKLERLEKDRLARMKGTQEVSASHKSADDLDDGFVLSPTAPLSYGEDGLPLLTDGPTDDGTQSGESSEYESAEGDEESDEEDDDDKYSDLESGDEDSEASEEPSADPKLKKSKNQISKNSSNVQTVAGDNDDIPFVLEIPSSYPEFETIIRKYCSSSPSGHLSNLKLSIFLERVIQYNRVAQKATASLIFSHLLQFSLTHLEEEHRNFDPYEFANILLKHFHGLVLLEPKKCAEIFLENLKDQHEKFNGKKHKIAIPVEIVVLLLLCSQLFSASDFRHRVVSPALIFLLQIFTEVHVIDHETVSDGLDLCGVAYEFVKQSGRYCPEVINFLSQILSSFAGEKRRLLHTGLRDGPKFLPGQYYILFDTLYYINKFADLYRPLLCAREIFRIAVTHLKQLKVIGDRRWPDGTWPASKGKKRLGSLIDKVIETLSGLENPKETIQVAVERPKMLRLYEPLVEENFDGGKHRKTPRHKQEQERLAHKVKKEMKSAIREIKKDNAFLARERQKEESRMDAERKRKVNLLLGSLANQEGDYKKMRKK